MSKKIGSLDFVAFAYNGKGAIPVFEKAKTFVVRFYSKGVKKNEQFLSLYPKDADDAVKQLKDSLIDKIVCRNYGPKSLYALKRAGLEIYTFDGAMGAAIKAYESGELKPL